MTPPPPTGPGSDPATDEVMDHVAEQLRRETPPGWVDLSGNVLSRVWAATRHSWPVTTDITDLPGPEPIRRGDTVRVADRLIVDQLRSRLDELPQCAAAGIDLHLQEGACTGASIELIAGYGTPLNDLSDSVRALAASALAELLGPRSPTGATIGVHIRDVTNHDPRL